jgi:hypothetical protein
MQGDSNAHTNWMPTHPIPIFDAHYSTQQQELLKVYNEVRSLGVPNFMGACITLQHGLNMERWESLLQNYHDKEILGYLKYGWPINYISEDIPWSTLENQKSAQEYPTHMGLSI